MANLARAIAIMTMLAALVAGCGTPKTSGGPVARTTSPAAPTSRGAADGADITGAVAHPQAFTMDRLHQFGSRTEQVAFDSDAGTQHHTFEGPLLVDVLGAAQPKPDAAAKNGLLRLALVATGADGYSATLAWAEISPKFADEPVLLAYSEDGRPLQHPCLTVPGDRAGGRYVSDVVHIRVVDPAA